MRILCVHGAAINGEIFESKTTKLRSLLPESYSYEWPDGHIHVENVTTDGIDRSISRLESIIEEDGPFDGVFALCEGAMLVGALLFKHQMEKPTTPLPFRFAVFIAASLPFTWSNSVGHDVFDVLVGEHPLYVDKIRWQQQRKPGRLNLKHLEEFGTKVMRDLTPELERRAQIIKTRQKPQQRSFKAALPSSRDAPRQAQLADCAHMGSAGCFKRPLGFFLEAMCPRVGREPPARWRTRCSSVMAG